MLNYALKIHEMRNTILDKKKNKEMETIFEQKRREKGKVKCKDTETH